MALILKNPDGTYAVEPMLARAWETSADKIVFHLRDGIKFHDGSDLTADAVVWNLNRMVQNPKSFAKNYLSAVDSDKPATVVDPMTVQLNLTRPSAAVLNNLGLLAQRLGDLEPLLLKRTLGWRLVGPPVPVTRIGRISLFAVQVGMNPGTRRSFVLLCRFVGLLPIVFGIPPQAREGKAQLARRFFGQQGMAEFL